jgi:hypothetical protein
MTNKQEVEFFLKELKEKIGFFDIVFRPRDKNLQALADLDISATKRLECIMNLKAEDYYDGPKNDTYDINRPDYYEFGIQVNKIEVYIKISKGLSNNPVDCMSFHPDEFPMTYPLKSK